MGKAKIREKAGGVFIWVVIVVSLLNRAWTLGAEKTGLSR
jgi:hypothetical protein